MSRYWNADSDLDWQFGNAPPEEAPQEWEEEPMEDELDMATDATIAMVDAVHKAIPETVPNCWDLRWQLRKICLDYGDARGAAAVKNCNAIWSRK